MVVVVVSSTVVEVVDGAAVVEVTATVVSVDSGLPDCCTQPARTNKARTGQKRTNRDRRALMRIKRSCRWE
jgi:hypothetical protein